MKLPPDVTRRLFLTKKLPRLVAFAVLMGALLVFYFGFPGVMRYWSPLNRLLTFLAAMLAICSLTGFPMRFLKKGWEGEIAAIEMRDQWESYSLVFRPNYRTTAVQLTIRTPKGDLDFVEANNDRRLRREHLNALEHFEVGDYVYQSPWTNYTALGKAAGQEDLVRCLYCGNFTPSDRSACLECGLTLVRPKPPAPDDPPSSNDQKEDSPRE